MSEQPKEIIHVTRRYGGNSGGPYYTVRALVNIIDHDPESIISRDELAGLMKRGVAVVYTNKPDDVRVAINVGDQ